MPRPAPVYSAADAAQVGLLLGPSRRAPYDYGSARASYGGERGYDAAPAGASGYDADGSNGAWQDPYRSGGRGDRDGDRVTGRDRYGSDDYRDRDRDHDRDRDRDRDHDRDRDRDRDDDRDRNRGLRASLDEDRHRRPREEDARVGNRDYDYVPGEAGRGRWPERRPSMDDSRGRDRYPAQRPTAVSSPPLPRAGGTAAVTSGPAVLYASSDAVATAASCPYCLRSDHSAQTCTYDRFLERYEATFGHVHM